MLIAKDMKIEKEIKNSEELEEFLRRRHGEGVNEFWLSLEQKFPKFCLLVNKERSFPSYYPSEDHAGFVPAGYSYVKTDDGEVLFFVNTEFEEIYIEQSQVVPVELGIKAAIDFFRTKQLPNIITWTEL